ncbi:MAG: GDYXXLXY domain-containing protein [Verrucomicrobiota bacterium]
MKPMLPWLLFGMACAAQWAAPLASIRTQEEVIARGEVVRIAVAAPDPYDPLRGRYLRVRPQEVDVVLGPELAHLKSGNQVWVQLEKRSDELHHIGKVTEEKPVAGDYVQGTLRSAWTRSSNPAEHVPKMSIEWPFDRFYLNEKLAPQADVWLRENTRGKKTIVAELRLLKGKAVLTDLELDGRSFREILKERAQ